MNTKSGHWSTADVSAFADMHVSAFDGIPGQHLLTLPRGIHGNGSHLTDREAGRAEHAPKLSCPPWRILVNNNTPCFACKTAPVSARKPSVFAGGKHRTPGTIAEKPMFPGQGGPGPGTPTIPGRARGFLPAWIFCAKPFFSGEILLLFCLVQFGGRGAEKLGPMAGQTAHEPRRKIPGKGVCFFFGSSRGYHSGIPHSSRRPSGSVLFARMQPRG